MRNHELIERLSHLVGDGGLVLDADGQAPYVRDWLGKWQGSTPVVVRPRNATEVSAVMRLCHQTRTPVVPQGGNTGMSGGATPDGSGAQVILSLNRMKRIREVDAINLRQRQRVVDLAVDALGGSVHRKRVAVLGVSFKPESDDVRDSPALDVAVQLRGLGAEVVATDPQGVENARARHPQLEYTSSTREALRGADLVVLVTEWREYRALDPVETGRLVAERRIIDGRNVLDAAAWRAAGWQVHGLGRR